MEHRFGKHIHGLDTLRFFAALWVLMGHCGIPPLMQGADLSLPVIKNLNGAYNGSISGPAAVILFFIISGFCIHYPFASGVQSFEYRSFYVRRYMRIVLPMVAAILFARAIGYANGSDPLSGVPAWSLVAEIIYYTIYPLLVMARRRFTWQKIAAFGFVLAALMASTVPLAHINYHAVGGPYLSSWILGLPCWILGLLLAEEITAARIIPAIDSSKIWSWRLGGIVLGAMTHNLALQEIIGQHWTLNLFSVYGFLWIKNEVYFYAVNKPLQVTEWAGRWSYSIYLMHMAGAFLLLKIGLPNLGYVSNWIITVIFLLSISYAFFLVVEKPSHTVSRNLSRWVNRVRADKCAVSASEPS